MARLSSSKKIQRAARVASMSRGSKERRELGFPIILAMVLILGTAMVVMSRNSRAPALPPVIGDHWHAAYGVYDCDQFVGFFTSSADPDGIHSHNDGVIHIHPWNSSATGDDARFDVFLEAMGAKVADDEISGPGVGVLKAGNDCGGEPTVIRAARFIPTVDIIDPEVPLSEQYILDEEFSSDFNEIQLKADLEAFTIARVPVDAEIPMPPPDRLLSAFTSSGAGLLSTGPSADVDPSEVLPDDGDLGEFLPEEGDLVVELPDDGEEGGEPPDDGDLGEFLPEEGDLVVELPDDGEEGEGPPDDGDDGGELPDDGEEGGEPPSDTDEAATDGTNPDDARSADSDADIGADESPVDDG